MKINGIDGLAMSSLLAATMIVSGGFASLGHKDGAMVKAHNELRAGDLYTADSSMEKAAYTPCEVQGTPFYLGSTPWTGAAEMCNCTPGEGAPPLPNTMDCYSASKFYFPYGGGSGLCILTPCSNLTVSPQSEDVNIQSVTSAQCAAFDPTTHLYKAGVCTD